MASLNGGNIDLVHFKNVLKTHSVFCIGPSLIRGDPLDKICFFLRLCRRSRCLLPISMAKIIGGNSFPLEKICDILYHGL